MVEICCKQFTYDVGDGFLVDVQEVKPNEYIAWLWHEDYGIKSMMFGSNSETKFTTFIRVVEGNLDFYIEDYKEQYMEE